MAPKASRPAETPPYAEVALSVYELHGTSGINFITSSAGMGGAYHVGVEVYGLEWSFGFADEGTGVYMVHVGTSTLGNFHSRVLLGRTRKTPEEVLDILDDFRSRWRGTQYNLLQRNCAHFSVAFSKRLGFNSCPEWVNALAGVGAGLFGSEEAEAYPAVADFDWSHFDDDEIEEMARDGDHLALLEAIWRHAQEYTLDWVEEQKSKNKFEEINVEFRFNISPDDTGRLRSGMAALKNDPRLRIAVAKSTAAALGIHPVQVADDLPPVLPVECRRLENMGGNRVKCIVRLKGKANMGKPKPRRDDFVRMFKRSIMDVESWSKISAELLRGIEVETAPGQAPYSHRVQTNRGGGGEILFASKSHFTVPVSAQGTLTKLFELREKLQAQESAQLTLARLEHNSSQTSLPEGGTPGGSWWRSSPSPTQQGFGSPTRWGFGF
mmetsp:Transcript_85616/g.163777  ORF Transcript_85616/g.163777 Transcript_85616/m.163777 type:complete len:438 (-) Transcript_85616:12-1325(-)